MDRFQSRLARSGDKDNLIKYTLEIDYNATGYKGQHEKVENLTMTELRTIISVLEECNIRWLQEIILRSKNFDLKKPT